MPLRGANSDIVRRVTGLEGRVRMRVELVARFDYGRTVPWASRLDDGSLRLIAGHNRLVLWTTVPLPGEDLAAMGEFVVAAGETVDFVLTYGASHLPLPEPVDAVESSANTEAFWTGWAARCTNRGRRSEAVRRSLITSRRLPKGLPAASPPPPRRCRSRSSASGTGITGSAGSGTSSSPCNP